MSETGSRPLPLARPGAAAAGAARGPLGLAAERADLRGLVLEMLQPDAESPPGLARWRQGWLERWRAAAEGPCAADRPLIELARELDFAPVEVFAVTVAAAVEADPAVGPLIARWLHPMTGTRPTLGLVATLFVGAGHGTVCDAMRRLQDGPSLAGGWLSLDAGDLPRPERSLFMPEHLAAALEGRDGRPEGTELEAPELPLPASVARRAARHARALGMCAAGTAPLLVIRGGSGGEARAAARAVAVALDRRPLYVERAPPGLGPWLRLRGAMPVHVCDPGPGERQRLPPLPGYRGPVLAVLGLDGGVEPAGGDGSLEWRLEIPEASERRQMWRDLLAAGSSSEAPWLDAVACEYRHGPARIRRLGQRARHLARLDGRDAVDEADVRAAARCGEGLDLDTVASPVRGEVPDDALVLTDGARRDLQTLELRCRDRGGLAEHLGVAARVRYRPGVKALFAGPSGTGKTLAAAWLATRLGLPLYRVDLASMVSKYIGETEKNLARAMAAAEDAEVILLFDEADSLFGKRTEVKGANDRFANTQTNYLLQRLETFDGIALLTTNSRARMDDAFTRRLDSVVDFPAPGPRQRRELWRVHLGDASSLTRAELNRLAAMVDLAGGHLRNAVLAASVWARHEGRVLGFEHLVRGLEVEYRKLGRTLPPELRTTPAAGPAPPGSRES